MATQTSKTKISIKFKQKINQKTETQEKPLKKKIKVSCLFLDEGVFLYEDSTGKLYSTESPHKFIGNVSEVCPSVISSAERAVCTVY